MNLSASFKLFIIFFYFIIISFRFSCLPVISLPGVINLLTFSIYFYYFFSVFFSGFDSLTNGCGGLVRWSLTIF